ncbi:unnamed protein product [Hydatigera taeniaeformis]|uniref:Ubiquitin-like modifier-activating enzyme 5 n=1 Tax=Hydatigena taeniaeformis TaxID=6205 RepID=A0A0R3X903_HYDTA|nr:unnamed protein product [Hydatigera taeniaeformis]
MPRKNNVMALKSKIAQLETELGKARPVRQKIAQISGEVTSTNPYSRLMALQKMGVVENYAQIREKAVAIVGLGGVGSVAAEMLVRCGIGRLILFDYDKVELANMNRLFFQPHQVGLSKVQAAEATLQLINPDVSLESHNYDITLVDNFDAFLTTLRGNAGTPVDLVWFESGVSEDALSCHFQLMYPGRTACFECMPPLVVAAGLNDTKVLKRDGVCAASLPTTMAIVAGLMVQNVLKFLLNFGEVSSYFGYGAAKDTVYRVDLRPNPLCADAWCRQRQKERRAQLIIRGLPEDAPWDAEVQMSVAAERERLARENAIAPLHADNEFQIELVGSSVVDETCSEDAAPVASVVTSEELAETGRSDNKVSNDGPSLYELMEKLRGL